MNKFLSIITFVALSSVAAPGFAQDAEKGKALYATCIQCHGEKGEGNPDKKAPKLSGQHDWYVLKQVQDFKSGVRKNPDMAPYIKDINDQDIKDLAAYILTL